MKKLITSGVRYNDVEDNFIFDYENNFPEDIIHIQPPQIYETSYHGKVYNFGYKFNDDVYSPIRSKFISFIKGTSDIQISQSELFKFIELPLQALDGKINLMNIDGCVYPRSTGNVVKSMIRVIGDYTSHNVSYMTYELVKSAPINIGFDWEKFNAHYEDIRGYTQMKKYVNKELLPKIHGLDYFSLSRDVKYKYREYITNYLEFPDIESLKKYEKLKGQNILIVYDISTSGSTLNEILRILLTVNFECNIYIYTLIGNQK